MLKDRLFIRPKPFCLKMILWLRSKVGVWFFFENWFFHLLLCSDLKSCGYEGESRIAYLFYCLLWEIRTMWGFYSFDNLENKARSNLCPVRDSQQDLTRFPTFCLLPISSHCLRISWEPSWALTVLYTSRGLKEGTHKLQCLARRAGGMGTYPVLKEHSVLGIAKDNWGIG